VDGDAASRETEQLSLLHAVEYAADIETGVTDFDSQLLHQDAELFLACRVEGVVGKEAHDALFEGSRRAAPCGVGVTLALS